MSYVVEKVKPVESEILRTEGAENGVSDNTAAGQSMPDIVAEGLLGDWIPPIVIKVSRAIARVSVVTLFLAMKTPPFLQKFCPTPKIYKNLVVAQKLWTLKDF